MYVCIHTANVRNIPDVVGDPHRTMSIDLALRVNKGLAADKNGHFANMASYQVLLFIERWVDMKILE